jgi:AraC family transcriptional regulator
VTESSKEPGVSVAELFLVFNRAHRSVSAYVEAGITTRGLFLSDFAVLELLLHKGPAALDTIAGKTAFLLDSTIATVDRLEKKGLVRWRDAQRDARRSRTIELTPRGRALISDVYQGHVEDIERAVTPLSPSERLQFFSAAKKIGHHSEGLQLARFTDRPGGLSPSQLRRASRYLASSSMAPPSVADVAAKLHMSPSQFSRAFKVSTGMPPHRWQLSHRIAKAQELLLYGDLPLAQIALAAGFGEQSHFSRVFKGIVGISPGTWQRANRR